MKTIPPIAEIIETFADYNYTDFGVYIQYMLQLNKK